MQSMASHMEPIKKASVVLESSKEPTIHIAAFTLLKLIYAPEPSVNWSSKDADVGTHFARAFRRKLAEYIDNHELLMCYTIGALLDPR